MAGGTGSDDSSKLERLIFGPKNIGYAIGRVVMKGAGYPILGALSHNLKSRIEKKLGTNWFNSKNATDVNEVFNGVAYIAGTAIPLYYYTQNDGYAFLAVCAGSFVACLEFLIRDDYKKKGINAASLLGKIASILPEYIISRRDKAKSKIEFDQQD